MKDKKLFLRKVTAVAFVVFALLVLTGVGIGFGRQVWNGQAYRADAKAMAAGENGQTEAKKIAVQYQSLDVKQVFSKDIASGSLLQVAAYTIEKNRMAEETGHGNEVCDGVYESISTLALAQSAMEAVEQETLELMASPAGSVWGGLIKVYAGETPLLITEEDKEVLLRIVEAEATCEDIKGRMLVANVILNRVVSEKFPDSIAEVVFQNNGVTYQFAPIKDGRYWSVNVSEETKEAVERVLAGEDYSQGALYFAARRMANQKAMSWFDTSLKYLFRHGVHEFFADK